MNTNYVGFKPLTLTYLFALEIKERVSMLKGYYAKIKIQSHQ